MNKKKVILALIGAALLLAAPAISDDGFNAQMFRPSLFGGHFIAIQDARTLCPWGFGGSLLVDYANNPFLLLNQDGEPEVDMVNNLLTGHLTAGLGTVSWMSLGVEVPVHFMAQTQSFDDPADLQDASSQKSKTGLGDILASIKFRVLPESQYWLGLALAPYATFPTGDPDILLGEGRVTGGGTLILEHDFGFLNFALNGGYQYRGSADLFNTKVGDAVKYGAGLSRAFENGLSFSIEYFGSWFQVEETEHFNNLPMEGFASLRYQFGSRGPRLIAGGGAGLSDSVGAPAYRVVGGLDYYYCAPPAPVPTQGNLIVKTVDQDQNPLSADLDLTGPAGQKFSAHTADGKWQSKLNAGEYQVSATLSGYEPAAGAGVVKVNEATLVELMLKKIFVTTVSVTVTDAATGAKLDSMVTFNPGTGQQKVYPNADGQLSTKFEPGTYKIAVTAKSYEPAGAEVTVVKGQHNSFEFKLNQKKIKTIGKIYFAFDSDVILAKSFPVLDNVVSQIKDLKEFKKIIIEGHCSEEGSVEYNMKLSERRAASVMKYLIGKGIDAAKLEIKAYGKSKPIAPNDTEEGRSLNRRVEFIIIE